MLALFLGVIVSAGLYFAYLWPSVEPAEEPVSVAGDSRVPDPDGAADPESDLAADDVAAVATAPAAAAAEDADDAEDPPGPATSAPS